MVGYYNNSTFELGGSENKAQNGMGSKELHRIPEWQQVTLSWSDVTVTTTARTNCKIRKETCSKTILNSVSGEVRPGKLVAIMGAR